MLGGWNERPESALHYAVSVFLSAFGRWRYVSNFADRASVAVANRLQGHHHDGHDVAGHAHLVIGDMSMLSASLANGRVWGD